MLQNLLFSTIFYALMLGFGHLMCFIEPIIYETIPIFFLFLFLVMHLYSANCKALELRDFLLCAILTCICLCYYHMRGFVISIANVNFVYLAIFLPFTGYASAIRYKSLM